jgi:hypothetical protein
LTNSRFRLACPTQPVPELLRSQAGNPNHFVATALAGSNRNGGARDFQKIRKEFNAGFVGFAVDRRGRQRELQCIADLAGDRVLISARMDFDGEGEAISGLIQRDHLSVTTRGFALALTAYSRKSPSLRVRRSNLLQLRSESRATCPSRARLSARRGDSAPRVDRADREVAGSKVLRPPDLQ